MSMKLFDSELKVMEVLWREGDTTAAYIAKVLRDEVGWKRNTTYTVIGKCITKGAIQRSEPQFMCKALVSKEDVQKYETAELINKHFAGSVEKFFAAFSPSKVSSNDVKKMKDYIKDMKGEK